MRIKFPTGKDEYFRGVKPAIEFMKSVKRENIQISPDLLHVNHDGKSLYLEIFDKGVKQYPMREAFLLKLLKWFSFPSHQLKILDIDTITSVLNDYLLAIRRHSVIIKIEEEDALTITSTRFSDVEDSQILRRLEPLDIDIVYFTDFCSRFRTKTKFDITPFPDDVFGVGLNIVNSETGFKAFQINNYLLRYVCSNGAYVKDFEDDVKYYHYDLFAPGVYEMIDYKVNNIQEKVDALRNNLTGMKTDLKRDEVQKLNQVIFNKIGVKLLADLLENDRMPTKYELFNIITHRAKEFQLAQRILIEEIAGEMVSN